MSYAFKFAVNDYLRKIDLQTITGIERYFRFHARIKNRFVNVDTGQAFYEISYNSLFRNEKLHHDAVCVENEYALAALTAEEKIHLDVVMYEDLAARGLMSADHANEKIMRLHLKLKEIKS